MPMIRNALPSLAFAGALFVVGCASTESLVEKGERIHTGKGRFDGYFGEVIELREKVKALDSDLFPLRQPLTEAYDKNVDTSLQVLMEETKNRVEKYKSFGVSVSLRISPNPIVVLVQGDLSQDEADEATLKAVQESAVRSLATYREYEQLLTLARRYDEQRNQLMEQLDKFGADFPDKSKAEAEILGAGRVLSEVQNKLLKDMRTCSLMLVALSEAIDTGGAVARDAQCDEAMAHWKPLKRPARMGGKRAGGYAPRPVGVSAPPSAPTAAPAAPKQKPSGDFDM